MLLLMFAACLAPSAQTTTGAPTQPRSTTTAAANSEFLQAVETFADLPVSIFAPEGIGNYPVVVMFHGGGWYRGSPASTVPLADHLAANGAVVFNATYRTSSGGYPESFDDVACALRFAADRAPRYTSSNSPLTVVAHSAGAHLAAVVALAGEVFGDDCPLARTPQVGTFIGLAGPYDPALYSQVLPAFFRTRIEDDPAPWEAGSPYTYLEENPELAFHLIHGEADQLVPFSSSEIFAAALEEAGYEVELTVLPGVTHQESRFPEVVGETLVELLSAG